MASTRQLAKGDGNIQVDGNGNIVASTIVLPSVHRPLTHSLIHDLLGLFNALPVPLEGDYPLRPPVQMNDKLRFNGAVKYTQIIDSNFVDYARVDEVMKTFPDSERIVRKLRTMFLNVASYDEDGLCVGDGDSKLDAIKEGLIETIIYDSKFKAEDYTVELIEQFCIALIAYGVSKCKILEAPVHHASS